MGLDLVAGDVGGKLASYTYVHVFRAYIVAATLKRLILERDQLALNWDIEKTAPRYRHYEEPPTFERDIDICLELLVEAPGNDDAFNAPVSIEIADRLLSEIANEEIESDGPIFYGNLENDQIARWMVSGYGDYQPITIGMLKLVNHSDCDGQHTPGDALDILLTLSSVEPILRHVPNVGFVREKLAFYQAVCSMAVEVRTPVEFI